MMISRTGNIQDVDGKCIENFSRKTLRKETTLDNLVFKEIGYECLYWIKVTRDRDQWRVLVNMVMNIQIP
jgi:hypothetical protein